MPVLKKSAVSAAGLLIFIFLTPFTLAHNIWCKYILGQSISVLSGITAEVYAEVLISVENALEVLLPEAESYEEEIKTLSDHQIKEIETKAEISFHPGDTGKFRFYVAKKEGKPTGYAAVDVVDGKWGPIYYMLALEPDGSVRDVLVLEYQEKRGRPVAKKRFLKQFIGKSQTDEIRFQKDIRGVTGASISSRGMADGVRKMIYVFNTFYAN